MLLLRKYLLLLGAFILHCTIAYGQWHNLSEVIDLGQMKLLDHSEYQVTYEQEVYDPVTDKTKIYWKVLQIGQRYTKYWSYAALQEEIHLEKLGFKITRGEWRALSDSLMVRNRLEQLYKDHESESYLELATAMGPSYYYEEPIEAKPWTLLSGERDIGGYRCQKAQLEFRGRVWEVWYTPEIRISEGPWKLDGLPGLVLEAYSLDGEYKIGLGSVRQISHPIYLEESLTKSTAFKNPRYQFYRVVSNAKWNFGTTAKSLGIIAEGEEIPRRHLFYNPPELDLVTRPEPIKK